MKLRKFPNLIRENAENIRDVDTNFNQNSELYEFMVDESRDDPHQNDDFFKKLFYSGQFAGSHDLSSFLRYIYW